MTNTIEEWPREWQHSLLFHGVPVPDNESFYTKVGRAACSQLSHGPAGEGGLGDHQEDPRHPEGGQAITHLTHSFNSSK